MREYSTKEMKLLRANPYTLRVTKHKLYFTIRFKEAFQTSYEAGNSPRKVLEELGYDPKMFGQKQIDSISIAPGLMYVCGKEGRWFYACAACSSQAVS